MSIATQVRNKIIKATAQHEKFVRDCQNQADGGPGEAWEYGHPATMQKMIDSGTAWCMEGSCGRLATDYLTAGICFLPLEEHGDYYGNRVPSRDSLKPGTKGTLENAVRYWENQ